MLTRRYRTWTGLAVVAFAAVVGAATACDLNPQPLPPGFTGSATGDGGANTPAPILGGNGDASTTLSSDSGPSGFNGADGGDVGAPGGDAGGVVDGSAPEAGDGGDAGDAGDASDAGAMDGSIDANEDAE